MEFHVSTNWRIPRADTNLSGVTCLLIPWQPQYRETPRRCPPRKSTRFTSIRRNVSVRNRVIKCDRSVVARQALFPRRKFQASYKRRGIRTIQIARDRDIRLPPLTCICARRAWNNSRARGLQPLRFNTYGLIRRMPWWMPLSATMFDIDGILMPRPLIATVACFGKDDATSHRRSVATASQLTFISIEHPLHALPFLVQLSIIRF